MAYQIRYELSGMTRSTISGRKPNIILSSLLISGVTMLIVALLLTVQAGVLGDGKKMERATDQLVLDIKDGASVRESIQTFCDTILDEEN